MEKVNLTLSEKIEDLVKQDGRKASVIAAEIGINQSMLSKYQNGYTPTVASLAKIAQYFHVSVDSLLGLNDSLPEETIKMSARKYTGLEYEALQNLHDHLIIPRFSKEQKHIASWFISSVWFNKLIVALGEYEKSTNEYFKGLPILGKNAIVVDDGTKNPNDIQRQAARLDMIEIMLEIAKQIDKAYSKDIMGETDDGKL